MNLVELACIRASKEKGFYSENHSRVFSAILRFEELYLDELTELMNLEEKKIQKILDQLVKRKLIKKKNFKYTLIEPFESANSFLFG
ncbi:MAG: helix-turn-helix domain-containing protein [Candidatus Micrarchaeota archaeon]